jgi:hypothetical protein
MGIAALALLGALLGPQDLAEATPWTSPPGLGQALDSGALAVTVAGAASMSISSQTLTASVSNVQFIGASGGQGSLRTGDINLAASDSSGFSGIQVVNINTGFGSSTQAAVSVAAGGLVLSAGR